MSVMIQVRNVPDRLHRELVRRAEARGQSLTAYIQELLEREVSRPSPDDVLRRLRRLRAPVLSRPVAEYLREARGEGTDS